MKKTVVFVLLVVATGVLTSSPVLSSSGKKDEQPTAVNSPKRRQVLSAIWAAPINT
jgi:hypothetical protein